jgi:ATP-binding protein involved in chromosome partitioning
MAEAITEEKARAAIAPVKHPAIDRTLVELGIAKDVKVDGNTVTITLALPFAGVPMQVRQMLMNSLQEPLERLGAEVAFEVVIMDPEALQQFLKLELEAWKGL